MAKKIRFPLWMKDGAEVRNLQELQEYFDIDRVMEYYLKGKLETWLDDRYYDEAAQVRELDPADSELSKKLCEIFQVEYVRDALTPEEAEARNRKIERLREITDDEEIMAKVDSVAFSQEELADLLDAGLDTIYLCGKDFQIPLSKKNMTYIGIQTVLTLTDRQLEQYVENGIRFINLLKSDGIKEKTVNTEKDRGTSGQIGGLFKEISEIMRKNVDTIVNVEKIDKAVSTQTGELFKKAADALRNPVGCEYPDLTESSENMTEEDRAIRKIKSLLERYMNDEYSIYLTHSLYSKISVSTMFYSHDDIHSKSTAVKLAEDRVWKVYQYATGLFSKYDDDNLGVKAVERFMKHVKADVIEITNLIHNLDGKARERNKVILQKLEELLNLKNIEDQAARIAKKELEDSYYEIQPLYEYNEEIMYQETEHDPPGLFGKKDYWFDASRPYSEIAEELDNKVDVYSDSISRQFKSEIIKPILDLVQRLVW